MKKWLVFSVLFLALLNMQSAVGQVKELSVDECVQIALENNPDIIQGEFTAKIAGKDVIIALANFLPSVNGNLQYYHSVLGPSSRLRIDPGTGIPVPLQPFEIVDWQSSARLNVNQTLFDSESIFNFARAKALKKSADYGFEDTKQLTIYVVKERYYNLLAAIKLLEVAGETVKSSEESYKRSQVLFEVGKAPKSDVLQAKVQVETDRLSQIQAQNNLAVARASLNHILGFDVDDEIKVVDDLDVPEMEVDYGDALSNAMSYHPLVHQRMANVTAAKHGIGMAVGSYLPSLYGFYSYSWRHADFGQIENILDTDYNWYMGVQLSIPIFEGLSRFANLSKAKLTKKTSEQALAQGKRDVALETKQAYFEVQQAKKQIQVAQNAVEAAEEGLRLNQEKYNLGAGTMLDLIVARVSYTSAQSDYIQGKYNYKKSIARLQRAMGKLVK